MQEISTVHRALDREGYRQTAMDDQKTSRQSSPQASLIEAMREKKKEYAAYKPVWNKTEE